MDIDISRPAGLRWSGSLGDMTWILIYHVPLVFFRRYDMDIDISRPAGLL